MPRTFRFDTPESFRQDSSAEFAKIVQKAPAEVYSRLRAYGLRVELADGLRVSHDGRKVGIGSFASDEGEIHFLVAPKSERMSLKNILFALGPDNGARRYVHFESIARNGIAQEAQDHFTPAFLLGLHDEIVDALEHLLNNTHRRQVTLVRGGIKGRPLLERSLRNLLLGISSGILCQIPEDRGLRDYAQVLLATARDISARLDDWGELISGIDTQSLARVRFATNYFDAANPRAMSRALLQQLVRPPFPFGLKDVLYKCLNYWKWAGALSLNDEGASFGYRGLIVELDRAFEAYVGHLFNATTTGHYVWLQSPSFAYLVEDVIDVSGQRRVRPDHVFVDHNAKRMIIVDAKYREDVGAPDQIYQMIAYLAFIYPDLVGYHRAGVLVFPGSGFKLRAVTGFGHALYCMELPIETTLRQPHVAEAIEYIASAQQDPTD